MLVTCLHCGTEFDKSDTEIRKSPNHFCNRSCAASYNNKKYPKCKLKTITCTHCGNPVDRKNYKDQRIVCSSCKSKQKEELDQRTIRQTRKRGPNLPKRYCTQCNKEISRDPSRNKSGICIDCTHNSTKEKTKNTPIKKYRETSSVKDKHPSWAHAHVRAFCRSWNKSLTKQPCQNCGYDKHIELCHIKPVSSYPDEALIKEVNDPSNLLVLCRNCHWEFDHELISLKEIPKRI
jgi:hypothetical protein